MYSTRKIIEAAKKSHINSGLIFDDENKTVTYTETGTVLGSYEEYAELVRYDIGAAFESVCYIHATLDHVIRCKKCGTVIFTREDEDYEPALRCPNCTDYKTSFTYFTQDDLDKSEEKRLCVEAHELMQKEMDLDYEFSKKRGGKPNSLIYEFKFLNRKFSITCYNCRKSYFKGLSLEIWKVKRDKDGNISHIIWDKTIPLTLRGLWGKYSYKRRMKKENK